MSSEPSKASGQFHSVKGSAVEAVGNLTGATSWQQSGKEEHVAGEAEIKAAQAEGYVKGTADRVSGGADHVIGAVTGNETKEESGKLQQKKGEAQQAINKPT
ncbi:hypothetical protein BDV93DRAFT_519745 [Ceratobasidium sp. AG-I]|nr:hypothetical protein BDV93DRAFT_519745 [Ceratobasidium sp. AG-I]